MTKRAVGGMIVWVAILAIVLVGGWFVDRMVPPQHLSWKPLTLADPIGMATGAKLDALEGDTEQCFTVLTEGGVGFTPLESGEPGEPCALEDGLNLERSVTPYSAPVRMTCPLAAAVNVWERHVMQPAAQEILGQGVAQIQTYGTFSCRRMYGRSSGKWSEHAASNAIDISGFRLEDGTEIRVLGSWRGDGPEGEFLEAVFEGACDVFRVGLGPDYNAAHADHFHFDMGNGFVCR